MPTFYVENDKVKEEEIIIENENYKHLKNVLRYKIGDNVNICDGNGNCYKTQIESFLEKEAICKIIEKNNNTTESKINITLYQGLPKFDKLEQIIQKSTELGVMQVVPVEMERSVTKLDEKNVFKKNERWNKIALEASKQSGRRKIPIVKEIIKFKNIIENIEKYDIVLLLYENEKSVTMRKALEFLKEKVENIKNIAIIIGPEGGFSQKEVDSLSIYDNVNVVTVGPRILRTETAGIAALAMLVYEFEL